MGMVDCGATASAGPEAVVRGLISSILTQDKAAQIGPSLAPVFQVWEWPLGQGSLQGELE